MSGLNHNMNHHVNGRITSKVLAPPGGYSSFSLGGYGGASDFPDKSRSSKPSKSVALGSLNPNVVPSGYGGGGGGGYGRASGDRMPPQEYDDEQYDARERAIPGLEGHYGEDSQSRGGAVAKGRFASGGGQAGPLSGADYASQLREQIAMKKQLERDANSRDRERENVSGGSYEFGTSARCVQDYRGGNGGEGASVQQLSVRRMADARHDVAMNAYRGRMESDRERDIRRLQDMDGSAPGSNFLDHKGRRNGGGGGGDNYGAPLQPANSRGRAPPGGKSSFSIGWN